ncbi:MAG: cobalamin-dependent protein [Planctomycetota bacterium]
MSQSKSQFVAEVLSASASGFASLAAASLFDAGEDELPIERDGRFSTWQGFLEGLIEELSASLRDQRPALFRKHVAWARDTAIARGIALNDVRAAFEALMATLESELPAEQLACVEPALSEGETVLGSEQFQASSRLDVETPSGRLAVEYLRHALEGNRRAALELMSESVDRGKLSVHDAVNDVLLEAQCELGRLWQFDEVTIVEEHVVTQITRDVIGELIRRGPRAEPNGKTVIASSVDGDGHELGVRTLCDLFDLEGWRAIYLGSDLPVLEVARGAEMYEADLVALSGSLGPHREVVARSVAAIREHCSRQIPILVGGMAFNGEEDLWKGTGADGYASTVREGVRRGRELVGLDGE